MQPSGTIAASDVLSEPALLSAGAGRGTRSDRPGPSMAPVRATPWRGRAASGGEQRTAGVELEAAGHELRVLRGGQLSWSFRAPAALTTRPAFLIEVIVAGDTGGVVAVDPTGVLRWRRELGEGVTGIAVPVADRLVVAATAGGGLHGIDAANGEQRWVVALGPGELTPPVAAPRGGVWVGATDGVHEISRTGAQRWHAPLREVRHRPAAAMDGGAVVGAGAALVKLRTDGSVAWRHELGGELVAAPTVDVAGVVYVATEGGLLHAVRDSGAGATRLWTLRLGAEVAEAPEVGALGVLHVALRTGALLEVARAPGARSGTFLPASCECARSRCGREVELCSGEAGCHAIADCARRTGCRGVECRRPSACAETIATYGGETAQSAVLAAGTAECIQRECGGCR